MSLQSCANMGYTLALKRSIFSKSCQCAKLSLTETRSDHNIHVHFRERSNYSGHEIIYNSNCIRKTAVLFATFGENFKHFVKQRKSKGLKSLSERFEE